jgi:ABC-type bacteriocin/lantibiotic exporter with double-glycine peptidase domain
MAMFEFIDVKYMDILDLPAFLIVKEKVTTLVGASGSGKTTILRMLNKMISPTQGRILFNGIDLREINSVAHRRQVTMLSQTIKSSKKSYRLFHEYRYAIMSDIFSICRGSDFSMV